MSREYTHAADRFPVTRWSLVARAGAADSAAAATALNQLLTVYRPVLHSHLVHHWRFTPVQAEDVLHNFLAEKVLENNILSRADQERGRFRSFLLKSLTNYVISHLRRQQAQRRSPGPSNMLDVDELLDVIPDASETEAQFDEAWGRHILRQTLDRMQRECTARGRLDIWQIFRCRLLDPILEGTPAVPYKELVTKFDLQTPSQAANLYLTARRMFNRILRSVVRDTVTDEGDIDAEIAILKAIFS